MRVSDVYGGEYLKCIHLQGQDVPVQVESVAVEEVGEEKKRQLVLKFAGQERRLGLCKTNAEQIAAMYGDDASSSAAASSSSVAEAPGLTAAAGKEEEEKEKEKEERERGGEKKEVEEEEEEAEKEEEGLAAAEAKGLVAANAEGGRVDASAGHVPVVDSRQQV